MSDFLDVEKQEARLEQLLEDFSEVDRQSINRALELAKRKHAGQKRDEGTVWVIHPIRVACSLIEEAGIREPQIICGALLHDIHEYTDVGLEEIKNKFGNRLLEIVKASTRDQAGDTEQNKYERKRQHVLKIMNLDKYIRAMKACDYLDNARSWPHIPDGHASIKKLKRWFKEGENMYLPLAESVSPEMAEKTREALNKAHAKWNDYLKKL